MGEKETQLASIHSLLTCLEAEGVEHIFGVPGGPLTPLYEAISDRGKMKSIIAKHEEGAAFMANGYARVRGGLGVCCATSGPGGTNALTGIAASYLDSIPVVLITAQVATRTFGKGAAQESTQFGVDLVDIYRPITKLSAMLQTPEQTQDLVRRALRAALSGRRGPVHINIPADIMRKMAKHTFLSPSRYRAVSGGVDMEVVREAAQLLLAAQRPVILAGHGVAVARASTELLELAQTCRMPVATSPKGKGVFPENHPLSLGVFGFSGNPRADALLLSGQVDVLLVVGSSLGETATHAWDRRLQPRKALIHIDIDPREIGKNYPFDVAIVGDARVALRELIQMMDVAGGPPSQDPLYDLHQYVPRYNTPERIAADTTPIKPQRLVHDLRKLLPPEALLFVDIGCCMLWAGQYYEVRQPGTYFLNMGLGSMGHSVAAAIGGKIAAPDRPVVVIAGDCAFAMNGMEVHTAVENDLPVIWVIMNDGGHGMVHHGELLLGEEVSSAKFKVPIDVAGLATALGARSYRVSSPQEFTDALSGALERRETAVIDARIDPNEVPQALATRAKTLHKFFEDQLNDSPTSLRVAEIPPRRSRS